MYQAAFKFKDTGYPNLKQVIQYNSMHEFDGSDKLVGTIQEVVYGIGNRRWEATDLEGNKIGRGVNNENQAARKLIQER